MTSQADSKFRFLRVNPFRGLLVDENTWADAHDYHRNQMRFHLLALHGIGVVQGLDVTASQPPDLNVTVKPGLAIDPEGRLLLLPEPVAVSIPPQAALTPLFVSIEYTEKPTQLQAVSEGGNPQAARILEECVVKVSPEAPSVGIEVARISLEGGVKQVRNAINEMQPGNNEIDLTGRMVIERGGGGSRKARQMVSVGILRYGPSTSVEWKRHSEGLRRLMRDATTHTSLEGNVLEGVTPGDDSMMRSCKMLYLTGRTAFRYSPEEEAALRRFLDRGGVLWCEPCRNGLPNGTPDDFSRSCIELAQRLNRQPVQPRLGHPLLNSHFLFAVPPIAVDPTGVVVEANKMIIATGDYGCLWEGRGQERTEPPTRELLRAAQEFGINSLYLAAGTN